MSDFFQTSLHRKRRGQFYQLTIYCSKVPRLLEGRLSPVELTLFDTTRNHETAMILQNQYLIIPGYATSGYVMYTSRAKYCVTFKGTSAILRLHSWNTISGSDEPVGLSRGPNSRSTIFLYVFLYFLFHLRCNAWSIEYKRVLQPRVKLNSTSAEEHFGGFRYFWNAGKIYMISPSFPPATWQE